MRGEQGTERQRWLPLTGPYSKERKLLSRSVRDCEVNKKEKKKRSFLRIRRRDL